MRTLRRLLAGAAVAAAFHSVFLCEPAQAQGQSWSGAYLGGAIGWADAQVSGTYATTPTVNRHDANGTTGIASAIFGYQHQLGQFVLGVEGSLGGAAWMDSWAASNQGPNAACLNQLSGIANVTCNGRVRSLTTVGGRVGYALSPQWLLFASGGYAHGQVDTNVVNRATGAALGSSTNRHNGWYLGGGVDFALTRSLVLGVEYQRVSLDAVRHFDAQFGGCCTVTPETRDIKAELDIVRLRAAWKF